MLQQRLGITTIMVTHDQREAMTMADEIVVMEKGRIQQIGSPLDIYRNPVNEFVADFIGLGNILPVTAAGDQIVLPGGQRLTVPVPAVDPTRAGRDGVRLLIRPEDVCLRAHGVATAPNTLAGVVTFVRDVGASIEATIDCDGFTLTAATTPRDTPDRHACVCRTAAARMQADRRPRGALRSRDIP
jgi:putative spermidine/putrescine transport system ATP-binding protein